MWEEKTLTSLYSFEFFTMYLKKKRKKKLKQQQLQKLRRWYFSSSQKNSLTSNEVPDA